MKRKATTQRLIDKYLAEGKPIHIRNNIIEVNYKLICWTAKHYQISGYVELHDLVQEGIVATINWMENYLTRKNKGFFSKNVYRICCYAMCKFKNAMMYSFSEERVEFYKVTKAWSLYLSENRDEWSEHSLNTFVCQKYNEVYGHHLKELPTYFKERVDCEDVQVCDTEYELASLDDVIDNLCAMAGVSKRNGLAIKYYILQIKDISENLGVSASQMRYMYSHAMEKIRDAVNIRLVTKRTIYFDNVYDLCDRNLKLNYLTEYDNGEQCEATTDNG